MKIIWDSKKQSHIKRCELEKSVCHVFFADRKKCQYIKDGNTSYIGGARSRADDGIIDSVRKLRELDLGSLDHVIKKEVCDEVWEAYIYFKRDDLFKCESCGNNDTYIDANEITETLTCERCDKNHKMTLHTIKRYATGKEKTIHEDIGSMKRNDICFCGSGKKYKKCCLRTIKPTFISNTPKNENKPGQRVYPRSGLTSSPRLCKN
ncbi:MAG: hypothetical protein HOI21_02785 [Bacteroidetes Order II. Incertae sedis bacterium]|jgi:hypothetical protein|nr:hypothetical protein [Bacteroidetes Order II. bacterium]